MSYLTLPVNDTDTNALGLRTASVDDLNYWAAHGAPTPVSGDQLAYYDAPKNPFAARVVRNGVRIRTKARRADRDARRAAILDARRDAVLHAAIMEAMR